MAHKISYVDDNGSEGYAHWQMLRLIRDFAGGYGTFSAPTFSGTGTGKLVNIDTDPDSVTETWTIQCTAAATPGAETWSVTGSVSGAQADATTGVAYTSSLLGFAINTGATAFAVNDTFTLDVTAGEIDAAHRWTVERYLTPDGDADKRELVLKGQGLSGAEEIYIGFRCYQDPTQDYYNMTVAGFTGYVAANDFAAQPGYIERGVCSHNQRIDYWLAVNAQRILFGLKIGSPAVYEVAYVGKYYPYATPSQYPYPLAVCGTLPSATPATRYSDTSSTHGTGCRGYASNSSRSDRTGYLRDIMGNWITFRCLPWTADYNNSPDIRRDTGGYYQALKAVMMTGAANNPGGSGNVWGELDGVRYLSGFNNVSENTAMIDSKLNVMLGDVWRTGIGDYFLLEMD
ncbi:MAG TPA: hypothetical protein VFJ01_11500 [Oleiagrimonas sp.]|nr:hypothetical protein [Oleiagrimonas sp.]